MQTRLILGISSKKRNHKENNMKKSEKTLARLSLENFIENYIDILSKYTNTRSSVSVDKIKDSKATNKYAYIHICKKELAGFKKAIPIYIWCDTETPDSKPRFCLSLDVSKVEDEELLKNIPDIAFLYSYEQWEKSDFFTIDEKFYRRIIFEGWSKGLDVYKIYDKTNGDEKRIIEKSIREDKDEIYLSYYFEESESIDAIVDFFQIVNVFTKYSISDTTRTAVIQARQGQGLYRQRLMEYWEEACAVTNCRIPQVLRASHAKPWAACDKGLDKSEQDKCTNDRLSKYNGFLLSANLDALFDKGLITFEDDGKIRIAKSIVDECKTLGIDENMHLRKIDPEHLEYLHYHQEHIWVDRE